MRVSILLTLTLIALPGAVFAHATPVEMMPDSGAQLSLSPEEIVIRFSERLEKGSSRIHVLNTAGEEQTENSAHVSAENPYVLSVPLSELDEDVYTVSWSVVSADDGHFTRGSFAFSVGSSSAPVTTSEGMVQITSYPEVSGMFIEFLGNSLLWGGFLMFALVFRIFLREERLKSHRPYIERLYTWLVSLGVPLGILGALAQIFWKSYELAGLHEIGFAEALSMYVQTMAGSSTLWRIGAFLGFAAIFVIFRKKILNSYRFSIGESLLVIALLVFAYFRSIVSHATANPFHPEFSVFVNMLHLIEKDAWPGVLVVLLALFVSSARYTLLPAVVPRALRFLTANLVLLSLTASYIIWLHLKDFSNLSRTLWGENFLMLAAAALVLVALHAYHVHAFRYKPRTFANSFGFSMSVEAAAALMVIFFTSLVIITSPPLHTPDTAVFSYRENGASVRLERAPFEEDQALLTVEGAARQPIVMIGGQEEALQPSLTKRFEGGYVFPLALIANKETRVFVTMSRENAYDMHAEFAVKADDFLEKDGHGRQFDTFTLIMISIALLGVVFAWALHMLQHGARAPTDISGSYPFTKIIAGSVSSVLAVLFLITFTQLIVGNDFKRRCEQDGNMWHLMQPLKAGVPTSQTPREGCMWGMGAYTYMFGDEREYAYVSTLGPSEVTLSHGVLRAGVPTALDIRITNERGEPAKLFVDMEKLVHVVIVSKDQHVFAHVHPDDERPLTPEEIEHSHFTAHYTFPKAGEYIIAVDYAHGVTLTSQQFVVNVAGAPAQAAEPRLYDSPGVFGGYDVELEYTQPFADEVSTFRYNISKDGKPAELTPYLSAAMHIAVVKNDFSQFLHTHGEVHPPGQPIPPIIIRNGKIVHSMAAMMTPSSFVLPVDAHVIFPEPGLYTLWGQFKAGGKVIPTAFTVRVE